jgi:23S rRNA pseudouridine1911/1915/1917 synthase
MNTSGIVLIPKSPNIHHRLSMDMEINGIQKEYIALVIGKPQPAEGIIDTPIGKDPEDPVKRRVVKDGKESITIYKTMEAYNDSAMVRLRLLTGRTHQIRVHMSYIGHPIIGDTLYGTESSQISRQALHAVSMEFTHPVTGTNTVLRADLPEDMENLIEILKDGGKGIQIIEGL